MPRDDAGGSKRKSWKASILPSCWQRVTHVTIGNSHVEKFEKWVKWYIRTYSISSYGMSPFGLDDSVVQETNLWVLLSQSALYVPQAYVTPTMTSNPSSRSTMIWQILARTLSCKEAPSCDTHDGGWVNEDKSKFSVNEDWKVFRLASFRIRGTYDT